MKKFITSFLAFSTAVLVVRSIEGHQLDAENFGIALGGGLIAACLWEGLSLFFERLFHWVRRLFAKQQKEI